MTNLLPMRAKGILLLVWLGLWSWVWADESKEYFIKTIPEHAQIYQELQGQLRATAPPGDLSVPADFQVPPGKLVGWSGESTLITFPGLGRDLQSNVTVWLLHPRCKPYRLSLVRGASAETQISITLEYRNGWMQVQDQLPFWGPLLGLACLAVLVPVILLTRRAAARELEAGAVQDKARRVIDLVVPGDIEDPFLGARLDEFRILQRLGHGGMARVYRAVPEDTMDETQAVAIKVMNQELARDPALVKRFEREKSAYEKLNHPNIIKLLSSGVHEQQFYLAMELVRGSTLRAYVLAGGLPLKKVMQLMTPVLEAVGYANKRGIVHRDLKPENIMVTDQGVIKVMDFGLAQDSNFSRLTATGSVLGTPAYMAPEQIEGNPEIRSDQYALGVMLYEMLTGQLPFYDDNPVTIIIHHLTKPVPPLAEKKPELVKVGAVVERMLAKIPDERYRDLEHALTSLRYVM